MFESYFRHTNSSTDANCAALLSFMDHPNLEKIILFGSPFKANSDFKSFVDPDGCLPLLSALVVVAVPYIKSFIVFDGIFLTANGTQYRHVRTLLDGITSCNKAFFSKISAPFTSGLTPEEAIKTLLSADSLVRLTENSRPAYFSLISASTENFIRSSYER